MTTDELINAKEELNLPAESQLTLQLAVQGLDIPRPVESARAIVEQCRLMWK